ncbi:MAG: hypothetical protein HZA00_11750 [Nitrospinae bacterium]|nr:hypothetical protein [Nitrospinota bacterium]
MTKNEAVNTIINGIMFADYEMRKFVEALKMLSKDEIEKVSLSVNREAKLISSFMEREVQNGKETFTP